MVRRVSGFLTNTGQYFDNKQAAQAYEAVQTYNTAIHDYLEASDIPDFFKDFLIDKVKEFMLVNKVVVKNYLALVESIPIPEPFPTTAPVTTPMLTHEPVRNDPITDDPDEAEFTTGLGELDSTTTLDLDDELTGSLGEDEPSLPERVRGGDLSDVEEIEAPDEDLRDPVESSE